MPKILTIPKDNSSFPDYLNWELLRKTGIEHIEKMGSDLWTDYNLHDPGLTILEVLCYALTDLGYRTNFDIKDLLARSPEEKKLAPKTAFDKPWDDNFFTAAEILSCNPVTLNDFRKLLIDIPGVRNAWFELASDGEIPIAFEKNLKSLVFANPESDTEKPFSLQGLYEVGLELEPLLVRDACGSVFFTKDGILEKVYKKLNAHRNLCEDLKKVNVYGEEQIRLCAEIELHSTANPENVLLEIYKNLEEHLSPTLPFYTLQQMLHKKKSMEEIFEGRPLSADSHGFIDTDDLKKLEPQKRLYASDFYRIIMDIDGVIAVRNLTLSNAINNLIMHSGEKWCLNLTPKYRPHFDLKHSQITFYKGVLPFTTDKSVVEQRFLEEKSAMTKAVLESYHLDLPIPDGQYMDLEDYTSIMEDFPLTYGVGTEGIKGLIDVKRKGQSKQLKAYLLFFDQLLANYLSQLSRVRDLFSISNDENRAGKTHTYFTQILSGVPGIQELLVNYFDCESNNEDRLPPEDFPSYLQYIAENLENYHERRNRFLDHLLARFSESFSDYVLLMFEVNGKQHDQKRIIGDKADFLSSYPKISRNRGKAFDYTQTVGCEGEDDCGKPIKSDRKEKLENVSGLEMRVAKLIGIDNNGWEILGNAIIEKKSSGWSFVIQKLNEPLLKSKSIWETEQEACDALSNWQKYIGNEHYYRRLTFDVNSEFEYGLVLYQQIEQELAVGILRFPTIDQYCNAFDDYFSLLENIPEENVFLETIDGVMYYIIRNEEGQELLRFASIVENLELFKQFFKDKNHYCRKSFPVERTQEYGFFIVDDDNESLLVSSKRYFEIESREEAIYWSIGQISWSGMEGEAIKELECYFFQLYDFNGEKLLFESSKGFHSVSMAMSFFDPVDGDEEGFLHWATKPDNYNLIEKDGKYSFRLLDGEGSIVCQHPHWYDSEIEVQNLQHAIIYYLSNTEPNFEIDGIPGSFQFEVSDTTGNVLFISIDTYPTTVAAHSATSLVKALAKHRRYYRTLHDQESDLPYGFELVDRTDNPFASHPQWYTTACERDLSMDSIIYFSENLSPMSQIHKRGDIYYLNFLNPNGDVLLNGILEFPDKESAVDYWEEFLVHASQEDRFRQGNSEDSDYPFGFELLDKDENVIAESTIVYATEAESKMAVRAIVNLVRHTEWKVNFTGDVGDYQFWIGDNPEKKLLENNHNYPDEVVARMAIKNILEWGQNPANYKKSDDFKFTLKDAEGEIIATHPHQYESDGEVETAIFMVVCYLRNEAPKIEIPNVGGAFVPVIYDQKGRIALKGTIFHSDKDGALDHLNILLDLAAHQVNYELTGQELKNCQNGFLLTNGEGVILAKHPFFYSTAQERNDELAAFIGSLTDAEKLTHEVIKEIPLLRFQLNDQDEEPLIEGVLGFEEEDKVREDFEIFLAAASELSHYKINAENEEIGFTVANSKGELLAKSIKVFGTEDERDKAIKEIWLKVSLNNTSYRIFQDKGEDHWNFSLINQEGEDFLVGVSYKDSEVEAALGLILAYKTAQSKNNFRDPENKKDGTFSFDLVDKDDVVLAKYAGEQFTTEEDLDQAIENYLVFLKSKFVIPEIIEKGAKYHIVLKDIQGKSILEGVNSYNSIESAVSVWKEIAEAILESSNFEIVYDNLNCKYKVYIKYKELALAQSISELSSRTQAEKWIDQLSSLLKVQNPKSGAFGTECGYYFLLNPLNNEELKDIQIKGIKRFPSTSEALQESNLIAEMLLDDELFRSEEVEDQWQLILYDKEDNIFANVHPQFETEVESLEARNQLREFLALGGKLDCENLEKVKTSEEKEAYVVKVIKDERVFFESPNFNSREIARVASNNIHDLGQSEDRYNLITNEEECLYSFELTDKNGLSVANHPIYYSTAKERDMALKSAKSILNYEGMHLVEHILLRPRKIGMEQSYRFDLIDKDKDSPILQGEISYSSEEETWDAYHKMWVSLWKYVNEVGGESLVEKTDDLEAPCQYSFNILAPSEASNESIIIARAYGGFSSEEKRDEQLENLIQIIRDLEEEPNTPPDLPEDLEAKVFSLRLKDDLMGCKLMKPIMDHHFPGDPTPGRYYDPYSFRATVVLPYWPKRFQKPEFRQFIETTLRQEAPAHVFLRICWVDPTDMKEFEVAYCKWVSTTQVGIEACNAIEAKNNMVKTLCKLRSVYPVASLHDCQAPTEDSNRIVLNYSIIGSANS